MNERLQRMEEEGGGGGGGEGGRRRRKKKKEEKEEEPVKKTMVRDGMGECLLDGVITILSISQFWLLGFGWSVQ